MSLTIRHRTLIALVLTALVLPLVPRAASAAVDDGAETRFVQLLNQARAQHGLSAVSVRSDLVAVARRHSGRMADAGDLHHNPNLANEVDGWQKLGENVGRGPTVDTIHDALMNSPSHRANILSSDFTEVGVGVEVREGERLWVTQVFRQPMRAEPAPAPEPDPEPQAVQQPAAAAEPEPEPSPASVAHQAAAASDAPAPAAPAARPADTVTAAAAEPVGPTDGADHTTLMLAQLSARDLGMRVSEALPGG